MNNKYLIVSCILHALLLVGLSHEQAKQQKESKPGKHQHSSRANMRIIPKSIEVTLASKELVGNITVKKAPLEPKKGVKDCKGGPWYGGVGIYQDGIGEIEKVIQGYPAFKAGLRPGDQIMEVDGVPKASTNKITGEPGTSVTLTIFRTSEFKRFSVTLVRDKICTGEM